MMARFVLWYCRHVPRRIRLAITCVVVFALSVGVAGVTEPAPVLTPATTIPACINEDGSTEHGYQAVCYWNGGPNSTGRHYILRDGVKTYTD